LRAIEHLSGLKRVAWKILADSLVELSKSSKILDTEDVTTTLLAVVELFHSGTADPQINRLLPSPLLTLDKIVDNPLPVLQVAVLSYSHRTSLVSADDSIAFGSAWFDLGTALHCLEQKIPNGDKQEICHGYSKTCVKSALRSDPGNDLYWNLFGALHFSEHVELAQHAYIKAIEYNSKVSLA
jgi:superkiller protein 3